MTTRSIVGLSGPFSRFGPAHCPRCSSHVEATWPWAGWVNLRRGWFFGLFFVVVASPIWFVDMYVMMPCAMLFIAAIGPLNTLARTRPTCLKCGSVVEAARLEPNPAHG
jgi:ribosomal protein S27AE